MFDTQFAFIDKDRVPTRKQLQKSINALGYDMQLDPGYTPFDDEGFSPCVLNGETGAGFALYYEKSSDVFGEDIEFRNMIGNKNFCLSFCWSGSSRDRACVLIISLALTKDFGAVTTYEGQELDTIDSLKNGIEACFNEMNARNLVTCRPESLPGQAPG